MEYAFEKPNSPPQRLEPTQSRSACIAPQGPLRRWTIREVMTDVAVKHHLTVTDIMSPSRKFPVAQARNEFYYRAMVETDREITVIAKACNRHTATVMSGAWRHTMKCGLPAPRGVSRAHWNKWQC